MDEAIDHGRHGDRIAEDPRSGSSSASSPCSCRSEPWTRTSFTLAFLAAGGGHLVSYEGMASQPRMRWVTAVGRDLLRMIGVLEVLGAIGPGPAGLTGILPWLAAGAHLRNAARPGPGWLFLVAAELIASSSGLGFLLVASLNNGRIDRILLAIISLAVLGEATDAALGMFERWAVRRWT